MPLVEKWRYNNNSVVRTFNSNFSRCYGRSFLSHFDMWRTAACKGDVPLP